MEHFPNEVPVLKEDKDKLNQLMTEVMEILDKYPFNRPGISSCAITTMNRAKNSADETRRWVRLLWCQEEEGGAQCQALPIDLWGTVVS